MLIVDVEKDNGTLEDNFKKEHNCGIVSVDWAKRTNRLASVDQKGNLVLWS